MVKRFIRFIFICLTLTTVSGCLLAVAGAGLGGGYYFAKNYNVEKKRPAKTSLHTTDKKNTTKRS